MEEQVGARILLIYLKGWGPRKTKFFGEKEQFRSDASPMPASEEHKRRKLRRRGGVAQLGEHLPCKQGVKSSNLSISTRC